MIKRIITLLLLIAILIVTGWLVKNYYAFKPEILAGTSGIPHDVDYDHTNNMYMVFSSNRTDSITSTDVFYMQYNSSKNYNITNLSNSNENSGSAKLYIDNDSSAHVVWLDFCDRRGCPQNVFYAHITKNKLLQNKRITGGESRDNLPTSYYLGNIAKNPSDNSLYLTWNKSFLAYYSKISDKHNINDSVEFSQASFYPSICFDNDGYMHIAFINSSLSLSGIETNMDVVYLKLSDNSTYTDTSLVYHNKLSSSHYTKILIDKKKNIHIIWQEDTDNDRLPDKIYHSYSTGDNNWSAPHILNPDCRYCINLDFAVDKNNDIYVVWDEITNENIFRPNKVYYSCFSNSEWSTPINVTSKNTTFESSPCIAIDKKDYVYVFWSGKQKADDYSQIYQKRIK